MLYIENYVPVVKFNGLNTIMDIDFSGASNCALPASTTIGGSAVVALGDITSSSTTLSAFTVTNSGIFTGTNVINFTADSLTTGTLFNLSTAGITSGHALVITAAGTMVTTGDALSVIANSATTSTGVVRVSATSLTDGFALQITGGGANATASGGVVDIVTGAATAGTALRITNTSGAYAGTTGLLAITANTAATGKLAVFTANGLTSGTGLLITSSGTMTGNGNLLTLTANSATTAAGILRINATGLSTGNAAVITTSSNSTNASTSVEPVVFSHTMTGIGGVGGRVKAYMTTNVALGGWSNAFKGEVVYGASGYTTGLGSSILAEMTLAAGTTQGTYAPVEIELNLGSNAPVGSATSFIYASANGTATAFLAGGYLMNLQGLGAATSATNLFHTTGTVSATHGLRINIGGVAYDILLKASTYA